MRSILLFVLLTISLMLVPETQAKTDPWERVLPFDNATISYTISGTENGTQTLYIKDRGQYTSKYKKTSIKMLGMTRPAEETLEITTPDWVYDVNLTDKTAIKSINPLKLMKEEFARLSPAEQKKAMANAEKMGVSMVGNLNGEIVRGAETLLGYKCDKVTVMGVTYYTMTDTDIEMKSVSNMLGMTMLIEATKIDKGKVPADKFTVPAGITVEYSQEADAMIREQARMTIDMLVSGKQPSLQMMGTLGASGQGEGQMPTEEEMQKILNLFGGQKQ